MQDAIKAHEKAQAAYKVLRSMYAKRAKRDVVSRAERLYHKLACDAFVAKHAAKLNEGTS